MGSDDGGGCVLTREEVDALCALSEDPERCHWGSWGSLPQGVESANGGNPASPLCSFLGQALPEAVSLSPLLFPGGGFFWGRITGAMRQHSRDYIR